MVIPATPLTTFKLMLPVTVNTGLPVSPPVTVRALVAMLPPTTKSWPVASVFNPERNSVVSPPKVIPPLPKAIPG